MLEGSPGKDGRDGLPGPPGMVGPPGLRGIQGLTGPLGVARVPGLHKLIRIINWKLIHKKNVFQKKRGKRAKTDEMDQTESTAKMGQYLVLQVGILFFPYIFG